MEMKKVRFEFSYLYLYVLVDILIERRLLICGFVINNFKMLVECYGDINN